MQGEFQAGWKILIACAIGVGCGLSAIPFYTLGVFAGPLAEEFGWARGDIMLGFGLMTLASLLSAPLIGYFSDKHGVRKVALVSIILFAASLMLFSLISAEIWTFYLCWLLLALLAAGTTPITWTRAINSWFDKKRGMALGLALSGTGVTAAVFPFYVTNLIHNFGVRGAYIGLGLTVLIVAFPVVYFWLNERPQESEVGHDSNQVGRSVSQALSSYKYWVICTAIFLVSIGIAGLIPNIIPLLTDIGFSAQRAASVAGLVGVSIILGRVVVGILIDHFWAPLISCVFLSLPAAACIILMLEPSNLLLTSCAAVLIGLAAGAEFDLMAFLVSRYFGMLNYAKIYSGIYIFFALGASVGPVLFGKVFDATGSYSSILLASSGLFIVGAGAMLLLGRYPDLGAPEPA